MRTIDKIEILVGVIQLRDKGRGEMIPQFAQYDDMTVAKMLCQLAVSYMDDVSGRS